MSAQDILNAMLNAAPDQVVNLESNIQSIDEQIAELQLQATAIEEGILDVDATALIVYLETVKLPTFPPGSTVVIGSNYNVINLTDWSIDSTSSDPLYEYEGVGWDSDAYIIQLISDWNFGYDYLTRALVSGATYGIYPQIAALSSAKSLLETNQTKIEASIDVLGRYV